MPDQKILNDVTLEASDIRQLENADQIAHFFAKLGYNVDTRTPIPNYAILGLDSEEMRHLIHRIELIGADPVDGDIILYLFEVRSITARLRNAIARRFRERSENALLILTRDYEELEFVLLERLLSQSRGRGPALGQTIRPIPLTANRRQPAPVALRVLKRFTFTEEDAAYQWEKLRSAYMLAEWSEEYFNNRALFSDYYLKTRLADPRLTPEWAEDVRPLGRELYQHFATARQEYTRQPEAAIRAGLYEPLFKRLGFHFEAQKPGASAEGRPDYLLYDSLPAVGGGSISPPLRGGRGGSPIAAVLTYVWNRNLDDVDEARELAEAEGGTPSEIPGALVVSLLEAQVAPWVIVTNGKLWRLYSATASNKATNYYEVDLEEALAANDQLTALKYWWLLFRPAAFTGFLDSLLRNSADYAKELGERLKERVFVDIFPQFARGFISEMRAKGVTTFDEAALAVVFSGTMTFLYRLMFILYAESLELLPVYEAHGYRELSLQRLKSELAKAGGTVQDEAPDKLAKHYSAGATGLYERLQMLFQAIDLGSDELNLPTYNGGLFSPETPEGNFLAAYAIPDRYLALGLDRLARDLDERSQALVFIDFKSLGVRQLGSIYEGLLEFKLRLAPEKLAVTRSKGREIYEPAKKVAKPLATIARGEAYLENDKRERKATGSYYTPDYIVKYIVRHTVGPVLERKFEELTPRLRAAQKGYRDYAKLVAARRKEFGKEESPAVYWNKAEMRQLVDDCLSLRALDPAMGSGHFLVEVVDFVSNRLIDFLNGWSENPVWAFLERTREDILADMERQQVTIDVDKLTRVALLKRAVLKRCVYGVDLNQMAVELAKVSLWLDAFTLGAPLSFLDHHLKHGNSLIGARVAEVQDYLSGGGGPVQLDLFSRSEFAGLMLATDLMRQVSYKSDNTPAQARQSAQEYRDARDHLAPFKRMLDVYTSRWFGNAQPKGAKTDRLQLFLKQEDVEGWLKDPAQTLDDSLIPANDMAQIALKAAEDKYFFHWELEFPEVFFAPKTLGGQDVQLIEGGGFDAVVGNPPYDELSEDALGRSIDEKPYLEETNIYREAMTYRINLYRLFIATAVDKSAYGGNQGFIVPMSLLGDRFTYELRKKLLNTVDFQIVEAFPQKDDSQNRVFPDAKLSTCLYVLSNRSSNSAFKVRTHPGRDIIETSPKYQATPEAIERFDPTNLAIPVIGEHQWQLANKLRTANGITVIGDYATPMIGEVVFNATYRPYLTDQSDQTLVLRGGHVQRYEMIEDPKQGQPVYINKQKWLENSSKNSNAFHYQHPRVVYQEASPIDNWRRIIAAYLPAGNICGHTISYFIDFKCDPIAFLSIFNSSLPEWFFNLISTTNHISSYQVNSIPFPKINFTTPTADRNRLTQEAIGAYDLGDDPGLLRRVQEHLDASRTDVVHDLLAHLGQRMIDLNQEKQAETKRFLGWLEARLKIQPKGGESGLDSLPGKSILQNYLGDYQKGEPELPWPDFHYRLFQNRNRLGVSLSEVEGEIQREFEASLAKLQPLKAELARTDALIDKIVYRLYGLTEEEIELIERPQYEQGLAEAKAEVLKDEKLQDDEARLDKMAEKMLPPAKHFFERVEPATIEAQLDRDLPGWRSLSPDAPIFLRTGDYNLQTLPEGMDFSTSVIPYTKAVETVLYERIFAPFRDSSGYSAADCHNPFLAAFMRRERKLTLGSFPIILSSSRETALRTFLAGYLPDLDGLVAILNDSAKVQIRNKAAHQEVLSRAEAQEIRGWALEVLGRL